MREPDYYNTTRSAGGELRRFKGKAANQAQKILNYFREFEPFGYTPSEICRLVFRDKVPLTSVRRAMTDLTSARFLTKTDEQKRGPYGRPEYVWRLRGQDPEQRKLFE